MHRGAGPVGAWLAFKIGWIGNRFKCFLHVILRIIKALSVNLYFVICDTIVGKLHMSFNSRHFLNKEIWDGCLAPTYSELVWECYECDLQRGLDD